MEGVIATVSMLQSIGQSVSIEGCWEGKDGAAIKRKKCKVGKIGAALNLSRGRA